MTPHDLNAALRLAGLTSADLAILLEVSPDTVKSWRSGRRTPCCSAMRERIELVLFLRPRKGNE